MKLKTVISMKRFALLAVLAAVMTAACSQAPEELYIPKGNMEFAGNGFTAFSLGADVKIYLSQNQDNNSLWNIQAVVPIRKELDATLGGLNMDMVLLDDKGIRVREGFVLEAEDLENLLPVYNSGPSVENTVVFSVPHGQKKDFSKKEAQALLKKVSKVQVNINMEEAVVEAPKPVFPSNPTVTNLVQYYGINGILKEYERAYRAKNKPRVKQIQARLDKIYEQIAKHPKGGRKIAGKVEDWTNDMQDGIEDRVDDER